jgi:translocation and assembly module TamB
MRQSRWRILGRILVRVIAASVVLLVIAGLAGLVVVQSGWFHEYVRQRIIAEVEHSTGGRVEIGRFSFRGPTLTATVAPLVLHGTEAAGDPPLLRAESVTLGLRILSFAERKVDLASIKIDQPQLRIVIYPDGSDNLPAPRVHSSSGWPEQMINLAVGHYEVSDGVAELDERTVPVNLRGDGLALKLTYDPRLHGYLAEIGSRGLRVSSSVMTPLELGFSSRLTLEKSRLTVSALRLFTPQSHADLKGVLDNPMAPHGTLNVQAAASLREAAAMFAIPIERTGTADFAGTLAIDFAHISGFAISGKVNARGVGYSNGRLHIQGAGLRAEIELTSNRIEARNLQADALGSHFTGQLAVAGWKQVHVEGALEGLSVAEAGSIITPRPLPWNGTLSGEVMADLTLGETDAMGHARLSIVPAAPAAQGTAIQGLVDASYDQHEGEITFGDSWVATPSTRLDASGALGRRMEIQLRSTDLADLLAALPLVEEDAPKKLPLNLGSRSIAAAGTVTGPLDNPSFRGQFSAVNPSIEGHGFDKLDAAVELSRSSLSSSRFTLTRGATDATGTATLTASQGSFNDATLDAQFNLRNANLEELGKEAGVAVAIAGTASAGVRVSGSIGHPQADITLTVASPRAFGESLDSLTATLKVTSNRLDVTNGQAGDGPARISFSGTYQASQADWKAGQAQLQAAVRNLAVTRVEALKAFDSGIDANITSDFRAQGEVSSGGFALRSASGTLSAQSVTLRGQPLGQFALTAETRGENVSIDAQGNIDAANLRGNGTWRLNGDENGSASIRFARLTLDEAHRLAMLVGAAPQQSQALPLEGFLEAGTIALTMALRHPGEFQALVTLDGLQFNPQAGQVLGLDVQPQDVVLKSAQPVVVAVTAKEARIQPVRLTGRDTNLEISGTIPFPSSAGGADLAVRGGVNLAALQLVNPSLLARGIATVEASVRGALADPALSGRMDLKGASLYLKDVTTGLDNVNGGVLFNRNRATIDKLTAQLGTGTLTLGGFVEFGSALVYRLQATAQQVRFRLPIDLSTTFSANLALDGTSDASTLSGTLTLNRAAFNPHTDLGELFAAFSSPVPEAGPNDYLRGVQLNVRVASAPNFEFQTSLTRDVQSEVDLRLRGTPRQPLLLGSISVDAGEVQVFGNQYTIDRGDVRFTNAVRIEPVFDLALETKVSGVTVNITFTGTMDRLRTNYSSDPPLEPSKIIALLAVGRDPTQSAATASAEAAAESTDFAGAGGGLLSQALSAQLSSKLQRFLGASRVKIDPTMTGIDNTPQARLTFEQQVSKDVTMTYITNLNYTAEQIVRLQWDLNRNWSAIAVRDANGLFGIDFQYRRRFK